MNESSELTHVQSCRLREGGGAITDISLFTLMAALSAARWDEKKKKKTPPDFLLITASLTPDVFFGGAAHVKCQWQKR